MPDSDQEANQITYDDLWLDDEATAFDCLNCGERVYINPTEPHPTCIACWQEYEINVEIECD